jgi:acyl-coenzyme A thioesterase PaaI-like protein
VPVNDLRTRRRHGARATGRAVKVGRTRIVTAGELHAVDSERSRLVATVTAILLPGGDDSAVRARR